MRFLVPILLVLSACAGAVQRKATEEAPLHPGGRVVVLEKVRGELERVVSASLYFYPGEFEIPLKPLGGDAWRGDLTAEQVRGMVRLRYGFRVYRCRLTVVSESPDGRRHTREQDLTIALEPGPAQ